MVKTSVTMVSVVLAAVAALGIEPCRIEVVDRENGWPVPLVELRTTHQLRFFSDNAGVIAMDAPELMNREVWFDIKGHGYGVKKDNFGYAGVRLRPEPGRRLKVEVDRYCKAKRLGRLTGGGLFAESQKCGERLDWNESGEFGCDTVQVASYRDRLWWFWGDTNVPGYPLGVFQASAATTGLKPFEKFEPPVLPPYQWFRNREGRVRGVARMDSEEGPTWIFGTVGLRDKSGEEKLCASYFRIAKPMTPKAIGQCVWNDRLSKFESVEVLWRRSEAGERAPVFTDGHPVFWTDGDGKRWLLFADPFPHLKCPATYEGWRDRNQWEILTPQRKVRSADGKREVTAVRGSIAWNAYRKRWVSIFCERGGEGSFLGEIWYAEAAEPTGPWENAVKVLSHDNYTFYNPLMHPELTADDDRVLLFEGTYTSSFADKPPKTPRYDYTQILYRLDLDELFR